MVQVAVLGPLEGYHADEDTSAALTGRHSPLCERVAVVHTLHLIQYGQIVVARSKEVRVEGVGDEWWANGT